MESGSAVTKFNGKVVHLMGTQLQVGQLAPNFTVVDANLKPVHLADFKGKRKIICTIPSLDTPVCDVEMRKFNQKASQLDDNTVILAVSVDLPFAQKRWCGSAGVENVTVLSDYQNFDFAFKYGVLIREFKLFSRAIFVVDSDDTIQYIQHVADASDEPDYASVLAFANKEVVVSQLPGDGFCGAY